MEEIKILVVDDEPKLVRLLREVLTGIGYDVITASSGKVAIEKTAMEQPDLVILDIVLADEIDGYEAARKVREFSDVPIIMLTAKARESDLLRGFDAGADDYLTKPFSSKELVVRVRAVLKRTDIDHKDLEDIEIFCGPLKIDLVRHKAIVRDEEIRLTRTEYKLLVELAKHRNKVCVHEQLLRNVWGSVYVDDVDYLRAYVRYLRRKIEEVPSEPAIIITHPGIGYELICPGEE